MQLETMPYQDISPVGGRVSALGPIERMLANAGSVREAFPQLIARRPYCADELPGPTLIRSRRSALKRRHLQLNDCHAFTWLAFDIDRNDAFFAAKDNNLPPPTFIAVNPQNRHAHSAYLLKTPVHNFARSRGSPLHYLASVERGFRRRLDADPRFSGALVKNPLNSCWRVEWQARSPYTLEDLAEALSREDMRWKPEEPRATGIGRNCAVFDLTRAWAYKEILGFKREKNSRSAWEEQCIATAGTFNAFPEPLRLSEMRSIGKSVARWTWKEFTEANFSRRQSACAHRRWAGHRAASRSEPWKELGVSRATYYRRKRGD